ADGPGGEEAPAAPRDDRGDAGGQRRSSVREGGQDPGRYRGASQPGTSWGRGQGRPARGVSHRPEEGAPGSAEGTWAAGGPAVDRGDRHRSPGRDRHGRLPGRVPGRPAVQDGLPAGRRQDGRGGGGPRSGWRGGGGRRYSDHNREEWGTPDLVLIDGGKGQLSAAEEAFRSLGIEPPPMISLAKQEEEIFRPGQSEPVKLSRTSSALRLLQFVR